MSKRKDLRNGRESGSWKPHKWGVPKRNAFTGHVLTVFLVELEREMPREEATRVFGKFLHERNESWTAEELKTREVARLGA